MAQRILIYGSRTWRDPEPIRAFVATLPADAVVIHGAQKSWDKETKTWYGVDYFADRFARERGLTVEAHPANWTVFGRRAGPMRNSEMAAADLTRARGWRMEGESRGTDDMFEKLNASGVPNEFTVRSHVDLADDERP